MGLRGRSRDGSRMPFRSIVTQVEECGLVRAASLPLRIGSAGGLDTVVAAAILRGDGPGRRAPPEPKRASPKDHIKQAAARSFLWRRIYHSCVDQETLLSPAFSEKSQHIEPRII